MHFFCIFITFCDLIYFLFPFVLLLYILYIEFIFLTFFILCIQCIFSSRYCYEFKNKLSSVISVFFLLYANMHYLFVIIVFCCGIFCTFFNSFFLCALHQKKIYICMHSIVCIASFCVLIFCLCIFCLSSQYFLHILFYFTSFLSILSAISLFFRA